MALDLLITSDRIKEDPDAREFIEHVRNNAAQLGFDDGAIYYDFPAYADYETVTHKPDILLLSRRHGVIGVKFVNSSDNSGSLLATVEVADESLNQFASILIGRFLKSRILREGRSQLLFSVTPVVFLTRNEYSLGLPSELESELVTSLQSFDDLLVTLTADPMQDDMLAEARSVIEGAKALTRPTRRVIQDPQQQHFAAVLAKLELEIANFDQRQRQAAIVKIPGPQRIRGLAGSGKTVILAMKAAHLHLTRPDEHVLVTFYTRSLRASLQNLITRFYRHYKDEDPDWDRINILHGWGGSTLNGTYADTCRRHNIRPLSLNTARQAAPMAITPFDFACRQLLESVDIEPYYDHVLIDEGQDFPSSFYELCFALAKGDRDSKSIVWAYDELQNILNVQIRSPERLFGTDSDGEPRVSLERSARALPLGLTNDTVLSKCYRNQGEVLVTAHALGFGIYGDIVQLLESPEHWQDVGYQVLSGDFSVGKSVRIVRPPENSPLSIAEGTQGNIIDCYVASDTADEMSWLVNGVSSFITGGLQPEDIIIIALDDRNARSYFAALSGALADLGIGSNNIIADPYNEPPFSIPGKVTLSTVYRAKGNEAAVVFVSGVEGVALRTRSGRNKLFTAFTRTKAWLRVSGVGRTAEAVSSEVQRAVQHFPYLEFKMPDLERVELIQRDLSERSVRARKAREEYLRKLRDLGISEDEASDLIPPDPRDG